MNSNTLFFKSHEILQNLLDVIKEMSQKKEVETLLRTYGFKIMAYLLNLYIQKRGCSLSLFDSILSYCQSFNSPELQTLSFSSLIFNFELFYTCETELQKKLISSISTFFLTKRDVSIVEQKHRIFYLFYSLSTFYPIDHALRFFSDDEIFSRNLDESKNMDTNSSFIPSLASFNNYMDANGRNAPRLFSRGNTVEVEEIVMARHLNNLRDLIEIREEIIKLIQRLILMTEDPQIFKDHINVLFQNIAKRNIGPTLIDFLLILKKLLLKRNKLDEANINSQINTPTSSNSPQKLKKSYRSTNRIKVENAHNSKADMEENKQNPLKKQKSILKNSRGFSAALNRDKNFFLSSIKLMDTCKLLVTILRNLQDQKLDFPSIKQILEPENYNPDEEIDEFLTLILHLLFNFLIEEIIIEKKNPPQEEDLKSAPLFKTISKNERKSTNFRNSKCLRSELTPLNILESLDSLLPDSFGPKTLHKLFDVIRCSLINDIDIEGYIIMLLFKRFLNFSEILLSELLKEILNLTSKYEELWLKRLMKLPNFMSFLSVLYQKLINIKSITRHNQSEENLLLLESFLNRFLFFVFYQDNAIKCLKLFILNSAKQASQNLEFTLGLVIALMDKFLNESNGLISQWKIDKDQIFFDGSVNKMLLNLICFLNFIDNLSFLSDSNYFKNPSIFEKISQYLEKFCELFQNLDLIYTTHPDFSLQKEEIDFSKLWDRLLNEAIKDETLSRPGGVLNSLISLIFNIITLVVVNYDKKIMNLTIAVKLLYLLARIIIPIRNQTKKVLETSNNLFRKLFTSDTRHMEEAFGVNYMTMSPFISIKNNRTSIEISPSNTKIVDFETPASYTQQNLYDILLYKVLNVMTTIIQFEIKDNRLLKELAMFLKEVFQNSGIDFRAKFASTAFVGITKMWKMNSSISSSCSFKDNNFNKEEFLSFGQAYNQEFLVLARFKFMNFHENLPIRGFNDITTLKKSEAFDFEITSTQNYVKSFDENYKSQIELMNSLTKIINEKKNIDLEIQDIIEEITKFMEEINGTIAPSLYLNVLRPVKMVEKLATYRLKVYLNQYQNKLPDVYPKNFIQDQKEDLYAYETFQNCEKDSFNINERFSTRVQRNIKYSILIHNNYLIFLK